MMTRSKRNEYQRRYRAAHPKIISAIAKRYAKRHRARLAAKRAQPEERAKSRARTARWRRRIGANGRKNLKLLREYGITLRQQRAMIRAQQHRCPICERRFSKHVRAHMDHDHRTKKLRAVLCSNCNQAIGLLKESPRAAVRAAHYLRKHGKE